MQKFTDLELQKIRNVPLEHVLSSYDFKLIKQGSSIKMLCPFHKEDTPSFSINQKTNLCKCFGCNFGGDAIKFVMEYKKLDFQNAVAELLPLVGVFPEAENAAKKEIDLTKPEYQKLFKLVLGYYHNKLKESKEAVAYLVKRGLKAGELLETFQVGYCYGDLLERLSVKDEKTIEHLTDMGILNERGTERFYRCVVFPLYDLSGNVVQIYGRSITNENEFKHNLLASSLAGIFNPISFQSLELFVCEAVIDAMSLMTLGYSNVTTTLGVNGHTREFWDRLSQSSVKKVYVCYDKDRAGDDGAVKLCEKMKEFGISTYRINLPKGIDANEFLTKAESLEVAQTDFTILMESAECMFDLLKSATVEGSFPVEEITATEVNKPIENYTRIGNEIHFAFGPRKYIIRGLENNKDNTSLKVFLKAVVDSRFHIDNNLDLFTAKAKTLFVKYSAAELELNSEVIKEDLAKIIAVLDELLKKQLDKKEDSAKKKEFFSDIGISYKARKFLEDPLFILQFCRDVESCGFVGEPLNAFFGFCSTLSRHLTYQIHIIIQSESSAGKSTFLNLLHDFTPPEDRIYSTQITPRSLYYDDGSLQNKSYFIAEAVGLKEAEFPIMQMMSEGKLAIDYTKNDPKTGENKRDSHEAKGPVQFNLTEPEEGLNEQMTNRSAVLFLNMSKEQTEKILDYQRRLYSPEGLKLRKQREDLSIFYQHVQREIKPLEVLNFYSPFLDYDSEDHLARRNNRKYLTSLNLITLAFQHQRERVFKDGVECVRTHIIDVAINNFCFKRIFRNSLDDLPVQTRNLLEILIQHFQNQSKEQHIDFQQIWFYRKIICQLAKLSMTRVHEHMNRLLFHEYLTCRRDSLGLAYRFNFNVNERGEITRLKLANIKDLLKKAAAKEKEEYEAFKPTLIQIFKALDPSYDKDGGQEI